MNMRTKNLLTILPTTSVIIFESQKVSPSEYLLFPKLSSDRRVARRSAGPYSSKKLPFMKSSNVNTVSSRNDNFSNFLKLVNLRLLHLLIFWLITNWGYKILAGISSSRHQISFGSQGETNKFVLKAFWLSSILSSPKVAFPLQV